MVKPKKLSATAKRLIEDPRTEVFVSSISPWELSIKYRLGKLPDAEDLLRNFEAVTEAAEYRALSFTVAHGLEAASIQLPHGDPFDRAIAAQAKLEKLALISTDEMFQGVPGLNVLW
jgi:PIN domain nuclease of toxin-antitoxin system